MTMLDWIFAGNDPGDVFVSGIVVGLVLAFAFGVACAVASAGLSRRF